MFIVIDVENVVTGQSQQKTDSEVAQPLSECSDNDPTGDVQTAQL